MEKKLYKSLIISNLLVQIMKLFHQHRHNFHAKFNKILEICKKISTNLVNDKGNIRRPGSVLRFSDIEVVALSMAAESESFDSDNWLFSKLNQSRYLFPNLISRRQYKDRRKFHCGLMEEIRKKIAESIDGIEDYFCFDSKPIKVCRPSPFAKTRKRIKTNFSRLTDQFMVIRNYAKLTNGLFTRIIAKLVR